MSREILIWQTGMFNRGPFDIPDVPDFIPRRLKPYLFIFLS